MGLHTACQVDGDSYRGRKILPSLAGMGQGERSGAGRGDEAFER